VSYKLRGKDKMSKRIGDKKTNPESEPGKRVTLKQLHAELIELQEQSDVQNRTIKHKIDLLIEELGRLNVNLVAIRPKKKVSLFTMLSMFSSRYNLRLLASAAMCFSMAAFGIFWLLSSM
tara:strand:+ start:192 stop:551 length:360 start_codon:yes stop_codon:yes gene_type:complete